MKYRPDIDGLRALAVIPVVLFHAEISPFSGGFVGVDVFFVISGYLITRLLLVDFAAGQFSLCHFYTRRVRRIFPALLTMVFATLVAGFFFLLPADFKEAGRAAEKLAYFFSNHLFWHTQNDYWQQSALASQPLLHTWSLAVEEQFYVVTPALLALWFWAGSKRGLTTALAILVALSAAISLWLMRHDPAAAFYTLPARAWQLALGSLLASRVVAGAGAPRTLMQANVAGAVGLSMILWPVFAYTTETAFPGLHAALPTVGAMLVIYAGGGAQAGWVSRMLGLRPLVWIGLISYSMYLWHWPLLVTMRSAGWSAHSLPTIPVGAILVLVLAISWASWRFLEQPFRRGWNNVPDWIVLAVAAITLAACYGTGLLAQRIVTKGSPIKQPLLPAVQQLDKDVSVKPGLACEGKPELDLIRAGAAGCPLGVNAGRAPQFALAGDSHARMWTAGADLLAQERGIKGIALTFAGCVPMLDAVPPTRPLCLRITEAVMDYLAKSPIDRIILAGYWVGTDEAFSDLRGAPRAEGESILSAGLERTLQKLSRPGRQIFLMLDVPLLASNRMPFEKAMRSMRERGAEQMGPTMSHHRARQHKVETEIRALQDKYGFTILDPAPFLCDERGCLVAEDGHTLYRDKHHLTDGGATRLREVLAPALP